MRAGTPVHYEQTVRKLCDPSMGRLEMHTYALHNPHMPPIYPLDTPYVPLICPLYTPIYPIHPIYTAYIPATHPLCTPHIPPTMGRLEMHTGLKLNSRGYSSMGLSVPDVINTLEKRSNTGATARLASRQQSCSTGSGMLGYRSSQGLV